MFIENFPRWGIICSTKALVTEEAIACLPGKALVQCENTQIITKTYLYPLDRRSYVKSICQNLNGPFSSVQSLSHVQLCVTPWTTARQASLSITNSQSPPKPMSIESVMPSNHLILCRPLLLLPSIFHSIRVFSNDSALCIRWPKYWSFGIEWSIRWLKISGSTTEGSLGYIWTSGTSKVGTFCGFVNASPPILINKGDHFVSRPTV